MNTFRICPSCQAQLPVNWPQPLCPKCLEAETRWPPSHYLGTGTWSPRTRRR